MKNERNWNGQAAMNNNLSSSDYNNADVQDEEITFSEELSDNGERTKIAESEKRTQNK